MLATGRVLPLGGSENFEAAAVLFLPKSCSVSVVHALDTLLLTQWAMRGRRGG